MRPILLIFLTLPLLAYASLLNSHDHGLLYRRDHSQLARRANVSTRGTRCRPKAVAPSQAPPAPAPSPPPPHVLNVQSSCGPSGATENPAATTGPNGSEEWLNCGLHEGGWNPPRITVPEVIAMDIDQALSSPSSPFQRCGPFIELFKTYASQHGIPPIMIASFALQESNCNPATVGGAGEQGLMQLTQDKCTEAPNGNCQDPDYNIRTGAQFFADTLAGNNGDVLLSIGQYNGWRKGLTYGEATAAASTSCCRCQNNADYLQQYMNGWLQNVNVYGGWPRVGQFFNLDICASL